MDAERRRTLHHVIDAALAVAVHLFAAGVFFAELAGTPRVVALVGAGTVLVGLGFWKLPQWQAEAALRRKPALDRFETENEARRTLGTALTGLFLVVGLAGTWLQLADS